MRLAALEWEPLPEFMTEAGCAAFPTRPDTLETSPYMYFVRQSVADLYQRLQEQFGVNELNRHSHPYNDALNGFMFGYAVVDTVTYITVGYEPTETLLDIDAESLLKELSRDAFVKYYKRLVRHRRPVREFIEAFRIVIQEASAILDGLDADLVTRGGHVIGNLQCASALTCATNPPEASSSPSVDIDSHVKDT